MIQKYLKYSKWLLCLIVLSLSFSVRAQTLPVDAFLQLNAPYSIYYADYYSSTSSIIQGTFIFQDFNEPSWNIRLRLVVESSDIRISTRENFIPINPIEVIPGVPVTVEGSDWEEYFRLDNVEISGITREALASSGRLPEGFYRFTVEALDYTTGKVLSKEASAVAWISMGEVPLITYPECGSIIPAQDPQNVLFQWQDRNVSFSGDYEVNYRFFLYEITDPDVEPLYAFDNGKSLLIYESEPLNQSSLQYDLSMTTLQLGKKYLFRVQIFDPNGEFVFDNDGVSQFCWFYYGYPTDGKITLNEPENTFKFASEDPRVFAWSAPDNLMDGQSFQYQLRIVELEGFQEEGVEQEQMDETPSWHEERTVNSTSANGWQLEISKEFEEQRVYAWQVIAETDGQQIAKSEIRQFYGPSLIDYFMAGSHKVLVKSLNNFDLNSLSGTGLVKGGSGTGDSAQIEVSFENLHIIDVAGRYVLEEGEILHDLENFTIELTPELEENNGATFYGAQLKLNKDALEISGNVKWPLPHPVLSDEMAFVTTQTGWVNFDTYKLFGVIHLNNSNDFELLDPLGFRVHFMETSEIQINQNEYALRLDGTIYLPKSIKDSDAGRVSFVFRRAEQLFYFEEQSFTLSKTIMLVDKTQLQFDASSAIIDWSEKESPLKLSSDKEWKGVYFYEFEISYPKSIDDKNQLTFSNHDRSSFELSLANDFKAWASSDGLTTYFHDEFEYGSTGTFNTFPANFTSFEVDIENNSVTDSDFKGTIKIPVFDAHNDFGFTVPMSNGGFEPGYLDENLEGSSFVFSPYGGENRVDFTIKRAVFEDNERMDLVVDIEIPYIEVKMTEVENLRAYGDYYIGFGKRNGAQALAEQVLGSYDGFTIYLDKIGAGFSNGEYQFSYSATMPLGEEMSGEEGAPRIDIHSTAAIGDEFAGDMTNTTSPPAMDMPKPDLPGSDPQTVTIDSLFIECKSDILDAMGYLIMTKDDPEWGTSLQGGLRGDLKMPAKISLGANMILGTKEQMKYWYLDAWFVDHQGMGINVFNMFNLVAFEGKIYRHMRMDINAERESQTPQVVIDPDVEFGAGMYMQMIDQSGGKTYMADVGLELVVESEHFVVSMSGDLSMLHAEGRDASGLKSLQKEIVKQQAQELATQALEELVDIDLTVDVGGGKELTVKADKNKGSFQYDDNGTGVLIEGDVSATPKAGLTIYKGTQSLAVKGSVDGGGEVYLEDGEDHVGVSYYKSTGAKLDIAIDGKEIGASFDKAKKAGAFNLAIDEVAVDVAVNQSEKSGHLGVQWQEGRRIYAAADGEGSGEFELEYDDVYVKLEADRAQNAGEMLVQVSDDYMKAGLNQSAGTAFLGFDIGDVRYDLEADKAGKGSMELQIADDIVGVSVDKTTKSGAFNLDIQGNKVEAKLENGERASLAVESGNTKFGIAADKEAGAGGFMFDDGNTSIEVNADKSAGTGDIAVNTGNDSVIAVLSPELKKIELAISGNYLLVSKEGESEGKLKVASGDKLLELGANTSEQSGYLNMESGDDKIAVEANKSERSGSFELAIDGVEVEAGLSDELKYLGFSAGEVAFRGEGNSDGGAIKFEENGNSYELGIDKAAGSGSIAVTRDDVSFAVAANPSERTGNFLLDVEGAKIEALVSEEEKSLNLETDAVNLALETDGKTNGSLQLEADDKKFAIGADKSKQTAFFLLESGDDKIDVKVDKANKSGEIDLAYDNTSLKMDVNTTEPRLAIGVDDFSLALAANLDEKSGAFALADDDWTVDLSGSPNGGNFAFTQGDNKVAVNADLANKSGSFETSIDDVTVKANYSSESKSASFKNNDLFIEVAQQGDEGSIAFEKGDASFNLTANPATKRGDLAIKADDKHMEAAIDIPNKAGSISYSAGSNVYALSANENAKKLTLAQGDLNVVAEIKSSGDKLLNVDYQNKGIELTADDAKKRAQFTYDGFQFAFSTDKQVDFSYNGVNFTANLDQNFSVSKNGESLSHTLQNAQGTINFADYTDGQLKLVLIANDQGYFFAYDDVVDFGFEKSGAHYVEINADEKYKLALSGDGGASFSRGDLALAFHTKGEFSLNNEDDYFAINTEQLKAKYEDYELALSTTELTLSDASQSFVLNQDKLAWEAGERALEITKDKTLTIKESASRSLALSTEEASINYDDFSLKVSANKTLEYAQGDVNLTLSETEAEAAYKDKSISAVLGESLVLKDGSNELSVSKTGGVLKYDDAEVKISSEAASYIGPSHSFEIGKEEIAIEVDKKSFKLTSDYHLEMADGDKRKLSISPEAAALVYDGKQISLSSDKKLSYQDESRTFDFSSDAVELVSGENRLKLTRDQEFELQIGADKKVTITKELAALQYEETEISFGSDKSLSYKDADRSVDFSTDGLAIEEGENRIALNSDKSIELAKGEDVQLKIDQSAVFFKYYDKEIEFSSEKSLSYQDKDRSFDLATTGLKYEADDNLIEFVNKDGERAIELTKGERSFIYADGAATVKDGDNSLTIGGEVYFDLNYDGKQLMAAQGLLKYQEGERMLAFGGDNFVHVEEGGKVMKLTKEKSLVMEDGSRSLLVSAEKRIEYIDGSRTFAIGGDDIVSYDDGTNSVKLSETSSSVYAFTIGRDDYALSLEGGKNAPAKITATKGDVGVAVSSDTKANANVSFIYQENEVILKTGKQGLSFSDGKEEEEEVTAEIMEGASQGEYSGPQYIGMVTDGADGRVKGHADLYFHSGEMHFIANASVTSVAPPCVQAKLHIDASPETWRVDIGQETPESDRIEIYPSCSGFGGGGWFNLTPSSINVGLFAGFKAGGSVDIGVAEVGADVWAELGVKAKAQLEPSFAILEAGVWVEVGVEVWVDPVIGSKFVVAGAYLRGELMLYFYEKTRVTGKLSGKVTICGISESFKLGFDKEI